MNLTITYKGQEVSVEMEPGSDMTLYSVPKEYSEDGLYIAQWGIGDLEPIPASGRFTMLLHLQLHAGTCCLEEPIIRELYKVGDVSYAEN